MSDPARRRLLTGLAATLALPGCAAWVHADGAPGKAAPTEATGISIVIFETARTRFAFHTAAIIAAPSGRALYDPAGWWADGQGQRVRDVTHGLTPEREAAYLERDYFGAAPGAWRLHRFDRDLAPAEAARALELAQAMPPLVFGLCSWGLTRVLSRLGSFADVGVWIMPSRLLTHLQGRDDLRASVRLVPSGNAGPG